MTDLNDLPLPLSRIDIDLSPGEEMEVVMGATTVWKGTIPTYGDDTVSLYRMPPEAGKPSFVVQLW